MGQFWFQAVGSEGEILPEHVGMPLGEGFGGATYFMLETHYDNPAFHKDLVDTSGTKCAYLQHLFQLVHTFRNYSNYSKELEKTISKYQTTWSGAKSVTGFFMY